MNNFKDEAERRYPDYQHGGDIDSITVNSLNAQRAGFRIIFNEAADFGYQQGIEVGMRFAEWISAKGLSRHPILGCWNKPRIPSPLLFPARLTTAELFQLFKKEQNEQRTI